MDHWAAACQLFVCVWPFFRPRIQIQIVGLNSNKIVSVAWGTQACVAGLARLLAPTGMVICITGVLGLGVFWSEMSHRQSFSQIYPPVLTRHVNRAWRAIYGTHTCPNPLTPSWATIYVPPPCAWGAPLAEHPSEIRPVSPLPLFSRFQNPSDPATTQIGSSGAPTRQNRRIGSL